MRPIDLDIDLLRCFASVAAAGSFTTAGEAIGLTQSGVSVRIRRLEERLQVKVLERSSRSVRLTVEGEVLLGYAQRLLDLNDEAVRKLRGPWTKGQLRIGIADYFVPNQLPVLLARFRRHFPQVRLEVRTGLGLELIPAFDRGELDLVVAGQEEGLQDGEALVRERLLWSRSPSLDIAPRGPLPLVALPQPCSYRRLGIELLDRCRRPWEIVLTSSSIAGVQAAVRAGVGVSVLPESALSPGIIAADDSLGLPPLPHSTIAAFARDTGDTAAYTAFVDYLRDELSRDSRLHVTLTAPSGH